VQKRLAERVGGSAADHASLVLALWALAHGTVELLISKVVPSARAAELREGGRRAVAVLLREAEQKRNGEARQPLQPAGRHS
jgi:hypothetical protein